MHIIYIYNIIRQTWWFWKCISGFKCGESLKFHGAQIIVSFRLCQFVSFEALGSAWVFFQSWSFPGKKPIAFANSWGLSLLAGFPLGSTLLSWIIMAEAMKVWISLFNTIMKASFLEVKLRHFGAAPFWVQTPQVVEILNGPPVHPHIHPARVHRNHRSWVKTGMKSWSALGARTKKH